ncbi:hypothetical protein HDU98_002781, partial [Podochytrium sp. JEL0797]
WLGVASTGVTAMGRSLQRQDGSYCVFIGVPVGESQGADAWLSGAVMLHLSKPLNKVKIVVEFSAIAETRWESLNRLASKKVSDSYRVSRTCKVFQQLVQVVYDSRAPLAPSADGGPIALPFCFTLPRKHLPPSFDSVAGSIEYFLKCTLLYQEPMKIMRSTRETVAPVTILMPDSAKLQMYQQPSQLTHTGPLNLDKIHYSVSIPKCIVAVGESLEVNVSIDSTPSDGRLRQLYASLRPIVAYLNDDQIAARATFPRPMAEISQAFPLVQIGNGGMDRVVRKFYLEVDPEIAQPSFESPLIYCRTILRIQLTLDNSEVPNISKEFPIVIVPRLSDRGQTFNPAIVQRTDTMIPRTDDSGQTSPVFQGSILDSPFFRPATMDGVQDSSRRSATLSTLSGMSTLPDPGIPLPHRPSIDYSTRAGRTTISPFTSPRLEPQRNNGQLPTSPPLSLNDTETFGEAPPGYVDPFAEHSHDPEVPTHELSHMTSQLSLDGGATANTTASIRSFLTEGPPDTWSVEVVAQWAQHMGAPEAIVQNFVNHAIEGAVLLTLTSDDLKTELGIIQLGLRRKMTVAIEKMRKEGYEGMA